MRAKLLEEGMHDYKVGRPSNTILPNEEVLEESLVVGIDAPKPHAITTLQPGYSEAGTYEAQMRFTRQEHVPVANEVLVSSSDINLIRLGCQNHTMHCHHKTHI